MKITLLFIALIYCLFPVFTFAHDNCVGAMTPDSDVIEDLNLPSKDWGKNHTEVITSTDPSGRARRWLVYRNLSFNRTHQFYGGITLEFQKISSNPELKYLILFSAYPNSDHVERKENWLDAINVGLIEELNIEYSRNQTLRHGIYVMFSGKNQVSHFLKSLDKKIIEFENQQ